MSIKWGLIGCGAVAEVMSGPAFYSLPGSELVAVMRRDAALAEDFAVRHGVALSSADADDVLLSRDVDAVYVATPIGSHLEYVLRAAAARKPVYVEKPMGASYQECREMVSACEDAGVPLWVAYYRRALPRYEKVKELIEEGEIGTVLGLHTWRTDKPGSGGSGWPSRFFEGACHTFDLLDFILGPIVEVGAEVQDRDGSGEAEDTLCVSFRFESGAVGNGFWSYAADFADDDTAVVGTAGRIRFSARDDRPVTLERGTSIHEFDLPDPPHVQEPMIQSIINELNGVGQCVSTGVSASRTAWVMDQILARFASRPEESASA